MVWQVQLKPLYATRNLTNVHKIYAGRFQQNLAFGMIFTLFGRMRSSVIESFTICFSPALDVPTVHSNTIIMMALLNCATRGGKLCIYMHVKM